MSRQGARLKIVWLGDARRALPPSCHGLRALDGAPRAGCSRMWELRGVAVVGSGVRLSLCSISSAVLVFCACAVTPSTSSPPNASGPHLGASPPGQLAAPNSQVLASPEQPIVQASTGFALRPAPRHAAPRTGSPIALTTADGQALKLSSVQSRTVIEGPLAFTELRLAFHNPESRTIEGRFRITLPEHTSVSRFAMKIGSKWQEGEVVELKRARRIYEDFLHRRIDPALLEQGAGNSFGARVFPIGAGEKKQLILSYSQELRGAGEVLVPLRGLPELDSLQVNVASAKGKSIALDKNNHIPRNVTFNAQLQDRDGVRNGELLLARVTPIKTAAPAPLGPTLLLVDTSASRALDLNRQLELARAVVKRVATRSGEATQVTVACFDQTIEVVYDGSAGAMTSASLERARRRRALGASNLQSALHWARSAIPSRGIERVVVLTDGIVTAGPTAADLIRSAKALEDAGVKRLDAVAFGGLRDSDGLTALVTAGLDSDGVVLDSAAPRHELLRRLELTTQSGIPIAVEGARWWWPKRIDGLQPGDAMLVYAEAPGVTEPTISIGGKTVKGLSFGTVERPLLARSLAKAKITSLVEADRQQGPSEERRRRIVDLGVQHRVVSPYTSLLVLETQRDYDRFGLARDALADILTVQAGRLRVAQRPAPRSAPKFRPPVVRGADDLSARGNMWGDSVGDAFGAGGLGLSGIGEGGSGRGEGIGLADIGTIGHGAGSGSGSGMGSGSASGARQDALRDATEFGMIGGSAVQPSSATPSVSPTAARPPAPAPSASVSRHRARPPRVRMGATSVSGRLPPEVIQRIVRQNFGRFRACYQDGLLSNPDLAGRVVIRFVIGRDGRVSSASVNRATLDDEAVTQCLAESFNRLTFPQPAGGKVTVSYPIVFGAAGSMTAPDPQLGPSGPPSSVPMPNVSAPQGVTQRGKPAKARPYRGRFASVMAMLQQGDAAAALADAQAWQAEKPGEVLALVALGEALEATNHPLWAARAYGSIIDLFPSRADLRRFAGSRLERVKHGAALHLAADTYAKARDQRPDHPTSHRLLAYALLKQGDHQGAFAAIEKGLDACVGRFAGAGSILREDLGIVATVWRSHSPESVLRTASRLAALGAEYEERRSLRFVLSWETDTNDVDLHLYDAEGGHAFYSAPALQSGGRLSGDVTNGYGPESFAIVGDQRSSAYVLQAHYYARGPMGYGMGKVQIIEHDGNGKLSFDERPFVVMVDRAFVNLGTFGS